MILCVGTTPVYQRTMSFDRLAIDKVNRAIAVADYASGKSVNVARVAHELGAEVLATGFVGGARGDSLCRDLDRAGVRHSFVAVAAQTRQCITVIDRSTGTATELVEESSPVGAEAWEQLEGVIAAQLANAKVSIFSGTLAPGAAPDFYARWLPLAHQTGATAIVDARAEALRPALREPNGVLKMNREELAATLGEDLERDEQLIEAMQRNVPPQGWLIVTLGSGGAMACDAANCWRVNVPKVDVISAVGSGDAFAAGLAVALNGGQDFCEALRLGAACGTANALTPHAGHVYRSDVERLLAQVRVESLV